MYRTRFFRLSILIFFIGLIVSCSNESSTNVTKVDETGKIKKIYQRLQGKTMGTTYSIQLEFVEQHQLQKEIDALLIEINQDVSTYEKNSFINLVNAAPSNIQLQDSKKYQSTNPHFKANYFKAKDVYEKTNGYFDPTVNPLVNYWGFGAAGRRKIEEVDKVQIEGILKNIGMNQFSTQYNEEKRSLDLFKSNPKAQLDFSALAKGYAVDAIAKLFDSRNIPNYFIEIGGETQVKGVNSKGQAWRIGINNPQEGAAVTDIHTALNLVDGGAVATSGNYRNFYKVGDVTYSHTINPKTGFPERNRLLSATVWAKDCMTADAYATAFMAMGIDKSQELATKLAEVEAYFIYSQEDGIVTTSYTKGMRNYIVK